MKKNGFTLAEVLITLTIIGVIATLTLPALITNTQEQQSKAALKKGINTLSEAGQMNQALEGFDYSGLYSNSTGAGSLFQFLVDRTSVNLADSGSTSEKHKVGSAGGGTTAYDTVVYFNDGSAVFFNKEDTVGTDVRSDIKNPDGLPLGFTVYYDINGAKSPNILSNCAGKTNGFVDKDENFIAAGSKEGDVPDAEEGDGEITTDCNDKTLRIIRDQFQIQLRGSYAQPRGDAARWAFNN